MDECKYCAVGGHDRICGERITDKKGRNMICTRPHGHDGKHVACGAKHNMVSRDNFA